MIDVLQTRSGKNGEVDPTLNFSFASVSSHMERAKEQQCHWSNVTERRKRCPPWDSNHTPSAIRADVLSQLD